MYLFNEHVLNAFYLLGGKVHKTSHCLSWVTNMLDIIFFLPFPYAESSFSIIQKVKHFSYFSASIFLKQVQYKSTHIFLLNSPIFIECLPAPSWLQLHCSTIFFFHKGSGHELLNGMDNSFYNTWMSCLYNTNCVYLGGIVHIWFYISYIFGLLIPFFIFGPHKNNATTTKWREILWFKNWKWALEAILP